jgi:hypothetical protein
MKLYDVLQMTQLIGREGIRVITMCDVLSVMMMIISLNMLIVLVVSIYVHGSLHHNT